MNFPKTTQELFDVATSNGLYLKLVSQLQKDFLLANIELDIEDTISPNELKISLHETIYQLIQTNFAGYLNLLYIVDVSEHQIKQLDGSDTLQLSEQVTFLVLLREWKKVWYKNYY